MDNRHIRSLLDRLNDHCVSALEGAAAFAATRGHYQVEIEHMAIKLLETGGGDFDRILERFQVNLDLLWQGLLENLTVKRSGNQGKPGFAPELFRWLERSWLSSSLHLDAGQIRSGALLDALVEMAPLLDGDVWRSLETVSRERLQREFSSLADGSVEGRIADVTLTGEEKMKQTGLQAEKSAGDSALGRFTIDITRRAAAGEIDPVLGRSREIRLMLDILTRRRKNNPIVVGDPGVGKTAVAEGLALRIVRGEVPEALRDVRLLTLDLGLLQAGAGVKGEFEKRLKAVIDEVKSAPTPIILFIDEAHTLIGAGGEAGLADAANLFKPALARGELRTIAATTWSEYKKYFERDAALARRFQLVTVDEPSPEAAIAMLGGLKHLYQNHHDILITDAAVEAAVHLSARYITGRQLPDKAIDLIDTAAARVCMGQAAVPSVIEGDREKIACLEERLQHLQAEAVSGLPVETTLLQSLREACEQTRQRLAEAEGKWREQGELVAQIRRESSALQEEGRVLSLRQVSGGSRDKLRTLQGVNPLVQTEVNAEAIAEVICDWTGVPVGRMLRDELAGLMQFEELLGQRVVGQSGALAAIGQAVRTAKAGLRAAEAPLGVFLLAGPSGVGKTETARAIADQLFGGERFLVTINMSEYQEAHTVSQLKGSPPGYVGYGEGGVLTEAVRQRPYCVILLDEVEKAHPDVMNLFYQVFDRGFMRDGEGREIDFKNTVIVMTTNLGAEEILHQYLPAWDLAPEEEAESAHQNRPEPSSGTLVEAVQPALLSHFAPALVARMQVIPFRPLVAEALHSIIALKLDQVAQRLHAAHGIELRCAPEVLQQLAGRCNQPATGARFINALIEQQLLPGVSRSLLGYMADGDLPDILSLEIDEQGALSCLFADRVAAAEECAAEQGETSLRG